MTAGGRARPDDDTWIASVHDSGAAGTLLGGGVVIDERRVLTCAHVAGTWDGTGWQRRAGVWVAFPNAADDPDQRLQAERVVFPAQGQQDRDLAVLHLAAPVPEEVRAAPLRRTRPGDLVGKRWWAFGFPDGDPIGDSADGTIGEALTRGWIRVDTTSRHPVRKGFSGGGLWSPDYGAVVGVVGQGQGGDGRAVTLFHADGWFPGEKIGPLTERFSVIEAGEVALAAWGWALDGDLEAVRHWRPRGRGVSVDSERGYRFRGREKALLAITGWLDRPRSDRRVLVVTGAPGVGKSAVLGRIVTTADRYGARELPATDTGVRASEGSVSCAVHAKGKSALEVAIEIARAASAALPERPEDFAPALRAALLPGGVLPGGGEPSRRFNVIIDALDEAVSPAEARAVIRHVIRPLAETCADAGAQAVVGSRRTDADGGLLDALGGAARLIDLDDPAYFSEDDLAAYARATLQLTGAERVGNPYADDAVAVPVAARIAGLSERNFLVAGLTARTHGLYDDTAVAPEELWFSPDVGDAMREYLRRIPPVTGRDAVGITAEALLTALAYAEAPGLPVSLWRPALRALDVGDVPEQALTRFARSSAASFLVESFGGAGDEATFRLFHQALNDALFPASEAGRTENEQALTRAFLRAGREAGWPAAPSYLLRSLPAHAIRARLVDEVLAEDEYLLHADLRRLLRAVGHEATRAGQRRGSLLSRTTQAITAGRRDRLAMFSVTEALDDLGTAYRAGRWPEAPYAARWALAEPRSERAILRGHGRVTALCAVPSSGGRALLAVASTDGTIRLWDAETGEPVRSIDGPGPAVSAMCPVPLPDGRVLLVTGGADGALRGWDPETGESLPELAAHPGGVVAACAIPVGGGRVLLASGGGRTVRLWDLETGAPVLTVGSETGDVGTTAGSVRGEPGSGSVPSGQAAIPGLARSSSVLNGRAAITDVCGFPRGDGRYLLAYGNDDGVAQVRDPETGELIRVLGAPAPVRPGERRELVPTRLAALDGSPALLAVGLHGRAAELWDPEPGKKVNERLGERAGRVVGRVGVDHAQAREICVAPGPEGQPVLALRGRDGAVRLESWAGGTARVLYGQVNQADTVCTVPLGDGRALLAAGDDDGVVRVWDPQARDEGGESRATRSGIAAACTVPQPGGGMLLATGGDDHDIQFWEPRSGRPVQTLKGHKGRVGVVCLVAAPKGRLLLASSAEDGAVRLWDPAGGTPVRGVNSVHGSEHVDSQACVPLTVKGRPLLVAGCRLWDLKSGRLIRTLRGPNSWFRDVRAIHPPGSRVLLATMSDTGTVRLWDPETGRLADVLSDPGSGTGPLCEVPPDRGRVLLAAGGSDGTVRLWDLAGGSQPEVLRDQPGEVTALCVMEGPGGPLLAAGSRLGTVTLWDPRRLAATLTIPVHHRVQALSWADGVLCVGLSAGLIALQLDGGLQDRHHEIGLGLSP